MTWDDAAMSVGVGVLDDDHKKMVVMINELFDGIANGQGKNTVSGIFDRLIAYTVEHFQREELFFAQTGYPDAASHKKQHENMTKRVLAFQQEFKSDPTDARVIEIVNFLWNWLVDHDLIFDRKYGPYLNSKGIK
jgi:hemerythrin-like metal-binding protein